MDRFVISSSKPTRSHRFTRVGKDSRSHLLEDVGKAETEELQTDQISLIQAARREDPSRVFSLEFQIVFTYILSGKNLTTDADLMKGVNHAFPKAMNLWGFARQWL